MTTKGIVAHDKFSGVGVGAVSALRGKSLLLQGVLTGGAGISATLIVEVTNVPADDSSWVASGVSLSLSGSTRVQNTDAGQSDYGYCRLRVTSISPGATMVAALSAA